MRNCRELSAFVFTIGTGPGDGPFGAGFHIDKTIVLVRFFESQYPVAVNTSIEGLHIVIDAKDRQARIRDLVIDYFPVRDHVDRIGS